MGYLAPLPSTGIALADPLTIQAFSTAEFNAWITALNNHIVTLETVGPPATYVATPVAIAGVTTSPQAVGGLTLGPGTWRIDFQGVYDWSCSTAPRFVAQLFNVSTGAVFGDQNNIGPGNLIAGASFAASSFLTVVASTQIQLRVLHSGGVGTINLPSSLLTATKVTRL